VIHFWALRPGSPTARPRAGQLVLLVSAAFAANPHRAVTITMRRQAHLIFDREVRLV
jgi:hypothetical protein